MAKTVSIIIPARNEEKFISQCLDSLLVNDYPKNLLEIFVVDGMSEDRTKEIVFSYTEKYPFLHLLKNPKQITPVALNIGVKAAKGDLIMRVDAHATYAPDYISKCVRYLEQYQADNVGGVIQTVPANNSTQALAISLCLSHPLGAGNSRFRTGTDEPVWSDTVFGGCYKREVFENIGLFNEHLARSQDMEFNQRLTKAGGKILCVPDISASYYPKATIGSFFLHNIKDGIWAIYPLKFTRTLLRPRHYVPLAFVGAFAGSFILGLFSSLFCLLFFFGLALYAAAVFFISLNVARKVKNLRLLLFLPSAFAARHFGYGIGSFIGLWKLAWDKKLTK